MNRDNSFKYEIVEHIAVLGSSGNTTKEINKVSYNKSPAKYDIRNWMREDGNEKLLKGITLTTKEAKALKEALNSLDEL